MPTGMSWRRVSHDGMTTEVRAVKSIRLDASMNIEIAFAAGDMMFERVNTRTGERVDVGRDGQVTFLNAQGQILRVSPFIVCTIQLRLEGAESAANEMMWATI
jgi:hypothetical protein